MARLPQKISGFRSGVINGILQYLQDGVITSSSDHRIEMTPSGLVIHNIDKPLDVVDFPFRVSVGGKEIRVTVGRWDRNGSTAPALELTPDTDKTFKTISSPGNPPSGAFANSTEYIVYLALERTGDAYDPQLAPNVLGVYADTSFPADASPFSGNKYVKLATCTTDGGGRFYQPEQVYWGGNIDDTAIIPDTNMPLVTPYISLEYMPVAGEKFRSLQIHNWHSPQTTALDVLDFFVFQDVSSPNLELMYITAQGLMSWIGDNLGTNLGGGETLIGDIVDSINSGNLVKHNTLDFTAGTIAAAAYANTDHDYRYPEPDSPANGTDANAGIFSFSNATAAGSVAGAIKLTQGGLYAAGGIYIDDPASGLAADLRGDVNIQAGSEGSGNLAVVDGDYYHGANQGLSTKGHSGGIFVNEAAFEASATDVVEMYL